MNDRRKEHEPIADVIVPEVQIPDATTPVSSVSLPAERFARSAGWVLGSSLVSSLCLGVVAVLTARELGPQGRSELVLALTVATFTTLITSLGLNVGARIHLVSKDAPVSIGEFIGLASVLAVGGGLVAYLAAIFLLPLAGVPLSSNLGLWVAGYAISLLAALFSRDLFVSFGRNKRSSTMDALGNLVTLGLVVVQVAASEASVGIVLGAFIASGIVQVILAAIFLRRDRMWVAPRLSREASRRLLKTGIPGIAHNLGLSLTYRLDRYLVGVFLGPSAVGIYAVAATATELLRLPAYAIAQVFFHRLASRSWGPAQLPLVLRYATGLALAAGIPLYFAASWLVDTIFGERFAAAVVPLRILIAAELAMAAFLVCQTAVAALISTSRAAAAAIFGLVVVASADLVLIPLLEVEGAAIASVIAYAAMAAVAYVTFLRWRPG